MISCLHAILLLLPLVGAPQGNEVSQVLIDELRSSPDVEVSSLALFEEDEAIRGYLGSLAETAFDYGIVSVSEFEVRGPDGPLNIRAFRMVDSAAAFGLFSYGRESGAEGYEQLLVGTEGYIEVGRIVFWQAAYVVELTGSEDAALPVARTISNRITGASQKPTVSRLLPPTGRVPDSERYILTPSVLQQRFGLDPSLLGFENDLEIATADYQDGNARATMVLLSYPTPQLARLHSETWVAEDGGERPHRLSGLLFAIVTSTDSEDLARTVLSEIESQFDLTFMPPNPDSLTIQQIILTAFTWIAIAFALTVVAGLGFGGMRIYLKTRYRGYRLGSDSEQDFLQLNINQSVTKK